ncbi:unnamed protein product, partial [Meganyctiphanes norvegica]
EGLPGQFCLEGLQGQFLRMERTAVFVIFLSLHSNCFGSYQYPESPTPPSYLPPSPPAYLPPSKNRSCDGERVTVINISTIPITKTVQLPPITNTKTLPPLTSFLPIPPVTMTWPVFETETQEPVTRTISLP